MKAEAAAGQALEGAWYVPVDVGPIEDLGLILASIVLVVLVVLVVIPLLIFGLELIIVSLFAAAGIVMRSVFGRPWIVVAVPGRNPSDALRWKVKGWRRSTELIDVVATELSAGVTPSPAKGLADARKPGATT